MGLSYDVNCKILLVDDSSTVRMFLSRVLTAAGYLTQTAEDAALCRRLYREYRPHIVLLDVGLPDDDTQNLIADLRHGDVDCDSRILLYSGETTDVLEHLVSQTGADGYVRKNNDPRRLLNALERTLRGDGVAEYDR